MDAFDTNRRRAVRHQTRSDAVIAAMDGGRIPCIITDINAYGARVNLEDQPADETFYLVDLLGGVGYKARVAWRQPPLVGTRFLESWCLGSAGAPEWLKTVHKEELRTYAVAAPVGR